MIRTRRLDPKKLDAWLLDTLTGPSSVGYSHRLLNEQNGARAAILDEVGGYVREAHEDAVGFLRKALQPTLAPFANPLHDPAYGYPADLHIETLMGYFGEAFAGLLIEHKAINREQPWLVPAFLFRFHNVAFQKLHARRDLLQQQVTPEPVDSGAARVPGRMGNDVLAFRLDDQGDLVGLLICEAKCLAAYSSGKAKDAHTQLSNFAKTRCPSGVAELIAILADGAEPEAKAWVDKLRQFLFDPTKKVQRSDVVVYLVGDSPKKRATWLNATVAMAEYSGKGPLEVLEVHIQDPRDLVQTVYRSSP